MLRLTGILREQTFSPAHHARNDRMILELTAEALRRRGCAVELMGEEEVGRRAIDTPAVFSMCQGPAATAALVEVERRGTLVINSPRAVQSCYRVNLSQILEEHWEAMAPMQVTPTAAPGRVSLEPGRAYWVKRGDVHATQQGDVVRVNDAGELALVLADFAGRGVERAVLQPHIEGAVVKFYGVVGTPFFRYYTERDHAVSPPEFRAARPAIEALVRRVGLLVYGGDAVLEENGRIGVIDINDWPSFAYYRDEASEVIAGAIAAQASLHAAPSAALGPRPDRARPRTRR